MSDQRSRILFELDLTCCLMGCWLGLWRESEYLSNLSAAYAESNDFPKAIKWIKKAMSMDN
ncbi:hypothetical protein CA54_58790 [Symmachiella macrocystis]|uniref:Uncharacterized protein n=1 Tax=Symmachiella macrocystis TaxID=2527985 RepID=A0A5C6B0T8_9PLAN|nr:tetratricopeptide repeat protein [Symmachiella macrocystis]TWU05191.1 hypothetical protein CA54_58790 [Symmachiella macrocystis]